MDSFRGYSQPSAGVVRAWFVLASASSADHASLAPAGVSASQLDRACYLSVSQLVSAPVGRAGGRLLGALCLPGWSRYLGIVLASTPLLLYHHVSQYRLSPSCVRMPTWVDAQLQFMIASLPPLLYPAVTIVGVKCMLDGARSFNGKVHLAE